MPFTRIVLLLVACWGVLLPAGARSQTGQSSPAAAAGQEGSAEAEGTEQSLLGPVVLSKTDNLEVTLNGRVHRMILGVDDGVETNGLFTDSEQGPTMLRFDVDGRPNDRFGLGVRLEVGLRQNRPLLVSQDKTDGGSSVNMRHAEVMLDFAGFGKISLGRGFASAWLAPEIDLSGTQFASLLPPGMLAPGLKFVDDATGRLSDVKVLDHFADLERLLLVDRVRFDSARFGGVQASASLAADDRWDVALRTRHSRGDFTVVGGASYQDKPFLGIEDRTDAGVSLRHEPTGLNLTLAGSRETVTGGRDATGLIVKLGWLADLVAMGNTAFSIDYSEIEDLRLAGDSATSYSFFVVQKWPDFGLDFYTGLRRYEVERPDVALKPLLVVPLGIVVNF